MMRRFLSIFLNCLVILSLFSLTACKAGRPRAEDLVFNESRYPRSAACNIAFTMDQVTVDGITVGIQDTVDEALDRGEIVIGILSDYDLLHKQLGLDFIENVAVFILADTELGVCVDGGTELFAEPEDLGTAEFQARLLSAAAGLTEPWVAIGLSALAFGQEADEEKLHDWYMQTEDLDMLGLFSARFKSDWSTEEELDIAVDTARSLTAFMVDQEDIEQLAASQQTDNTMRTAWLASIGVDKQCSYPYDGLFSGFTYTHNKDFPLIVQTNTIQFYLKRLPDQEYFDDIQDVEWLVAQTTSGYQAIVDYVLDQAPSVGQHLDAEKIIYFKIIESNRLGATTDNNEIELNRSAIRYYNLHELVHTFGWRIQLDYLYQTEGFAEYIGRLLPIYEQTTKEQIFDDLENSRGPSYLGSSYWFWLDEEQLEAAKSWYLQQGGKTETVESIDPYLFYQAISFATLEREANGPLGVSTGEIYCMNYPKRCNHKQQGDELSYTQAGAYIGWLCETYTLDRVLDVYVNGAETGLLDGKDYETLKAEWQNWLKEKGSGISIPAGK